MTPTVYLSPSVQTGNLTKMKMSKNEAEYCLKVSAIVYNILKDYLIVYQNIGSLALEQAVVSSNMKNVTLHVAIHTNANDGNTRGSEVYYYEMGGEGHRAGRLIYNQITSISPFMGRGVKSGKDFYGQGKSMYELQHTNAPACLIEIDYHDNERSANWLESNVVEIGTAIAKGILNYFGVVIQDKKHWTDNPKVRTLLDEIFKLKGG